ncbi:CDP-diacylglycerol--glycerol-3-phosphate 3-phosphatidyltransferase [Bryocella elongata]|uniref:CDP-diacylglycerol--glycerol-3-phosphate 3-phosphatidyltransferase n=1 Tax=Bryocella elongata TaxID=863522 RepID=UPI000CDE6439|nr:CDP-diacylglycerol--glycerol-3-phosphate 3-phosphatidyltransferase [Bryocella elongata]
MNLPNSITLSRIATVPVLIWVLSPKFPVQGTHGEQEIIASVIFILASITDGLDGYLARKRGQITTLGMLLDPLADKLMVTTAFILLVAFTPHIMKPWIVVLVIGREFLVSGLRSIATNEGFTIAASDLGKLKTVTQIVAVVACILSHRWDHWQIGWYPFPVAFTAIMATYWMTAVSVISAVDYFIGFWSKIEHASDATRQRSLVLNRKKTAVPEKA